MRAGLGASLAIALLLLLGPSGLAFADDPYDTLARIRAANPPTRDLAVMRQRIVNPPDTDRSVQLPDSLWVHDVVRRAYRLVPVELVESSPHADWLVERGRDPGDLSSAVEFVETRALPRIQELTGVQWSPGSNGQPKLAIFHGQTPGVAGYMSSGDGQPRSVFPYSNERLIIYLNLDSLHPGTRGYNLTLAHELEHLAHFVINPHQEGWLDEGLAELVSNLVTESPPSSAASFRGHSNVQLTAWSPTPSESRAHYEASNLWSRYVMERAGGPTSLPALLQGGGRGLETVDRFVRAQRLARDVDSFVRDWFVANLIDAPGTDGRYGYSDLDQRSAVSGELRSDGRVVADRVHQFAANYYDLSPDGPARLNVELDPTLPVIAAPDTQGAFFWSLRGDNLDTRLTRSFDLSALSRATLRYRIWYDLEPEYDVCYTLGSTDGQSWLALPGRWTRPTNTVGAAFGPSYTGQSGKPPSWLDEEIDLSQFAGGRAYVRFECSTDQGYSAAGLAIDNLSLPEIGFFDDAEMDQGWLAEGFVRAPNAMAQQPVVLVVEETSNGPVVRELPLDASGRGSLNLRGEADGVQRSRLLVAGLAPYTLEETSYRLWLEPVSQACCSAQWGRLILRGSSGV